MNFTPKKAQCELIEDQPYVLNIDKRLLVVDHKDHVTGPCTVYEILVQ
jgi:hypothetical protein